MSDASIFVFPHLLRRCHRRVFLGMGKSIDAMGSSSSRSPTHCFDESPTGYSWVGCSPAEPTCASPAKQIMPKTVAWLEQKTLGCPAPRDSPKLKTCKGCPDTNCKGCSDTRHGSGLAGWNFRRASTVIVSDDRRSRESNDLNQAKPHQIG